MVYITSDLFGPATTHDRSHNIASTRYSAMANPQHAPGLGKRKRTGEEAAYERTSGHVQHPNTDLVYGSTSYQSRAPLMSWSFAHSQSHNTPQFDSNDSLPYSLSSAKTSDQRPVKQIKRINPKVPLVKSASHLMDIETGSKSYSVSDLRPCHACNLAPKRKRDLENYLDCRRCDGRTCYICARQCAGECGKTICKKCIVEVGEEGDSWCLDCYSKNINL